MKGGYAGKLLFVDLTKRTIKEEKLSEDLAKDFIGGRGIGARVLYDMMKPGADPLGPDNVLGFVTGPLTGAGVLFSGRYTVVCKSPVSGTWNDSNSGGFFGPELKKAGFDGVFIVGASEKPVYLWIKDGKAAIVDASRLWGKDTAETLEALIEETGEKKLRAAVIGPAGEQQSLMAAIINDEHRAAARGGPGAVMGSKNLKAVAVRGTGKVPVADPARVREINKTVVAALKTGPMAAMMTVIGVYGTPAGAGGSALSGDAPVKNWGGVGAVEFGEESAGKLTSLIFDAKYKTKKYSCANCPLGCGALYKVEDGKWPVGETSRPEYETVSAFGTICLNDDVEAILKCNYICNRYGLDTISVGATVAWAMECYENGLFSKEDTGGVELIWGNAEATVAITQAIADQRGFGKALALGSAAAAEKLGKGAEYLQTVRGMELPMHDPKLGPGYARTYQCDPTPARHMNGGLGMMQKMNPKPENYNVDGTGAQDLAVTCSMEVFTASGLCLFGMFVAPPEALPAFIEAVTGWSFTMQDLMKAGTRIMHMRQAFNLREGLKPADFVLPSRSVGEPAQTEGPLAGISIDYETLADNFFTAIHWDKQTGKPDRSSLEMLGGMVDVIEDLYG